MAIILDDPSIAERAAHLRHRGFIAFDAQFSFGVDDAASRAAADEAMGEATEKATGNATGKAAPSGTPVPATEKSPTQTAKKAAGKVARKVPASASAPSAAELAPERRVLSACGENPFCGDELEVRVLMRRAAADTWVVERAAFDGYACTLCLACADAIMEHAQGMEAAEAARLTGDAACRLLGGLEVGRTRRGCVDLGARVLSRALAPMVG